MPILELVLWIVLIVLCVIAVALSPRTPINWAILIVAVVLAVLQFGGVKL